MLYFQYTGEENPLIMSLTPAPEASPWVCFVCGRKASYTVENVGYCWRHRDKAQDHLKRLKERGKQ